MKSKVSYSKKPVLAIELDDYNLKIVQACMAPKGWSIDKFTVEDIAGKSDDEISAVIKSSLNNLKVKHDGVTLIIPRSLATVRYLQLPTNNPNELRDMIDIQVVRQIPYTKEEMVYDYHISGLTEEGCTKIVLVIVHKDVVSKYTSILEKAGVTADFIELDSLAVSELCKYLGKEESRLCMDEGSVVILDTDYSSTNIVITQNGDLSFTRAVSIGNMHFSGKAPAPAGKDWVNEWVGEINRSLNVYQKDKAAPINKIIFFGDGNDKLINELISKLAFPVEKYNISKYVTGLSAPEIKIGGKEESGNVSVISLLGAVREGVNTSVNLLPFEVKNQRMARQRRSSMAFTILLAAGILVALGSTMHKKVQDRRVYLSVIDGKLKETGPLAKELAVKKDRLALIKKQLSVEGTGLDVLRELYSIVPQKTALDVFVYDDIQGVTIKGVSPAMSEVFDLVPKLENSQYFEKVTTRSATQRKIKGQELTDFQIDCVVTPPKSGE